MIAWAVVTDDNLHRRPKRAPVTLPAACGFRVEDVSRASLSRIPLGRYGDPAEYGRLAVFLGSEANTYITGQTIFVNGGWYMH